MNLYLVESPLQLLSAIEHQRVTLPNSSVAILRYEARDGRRNKAQMRMLLEFASFHEVLEVEGSFKVTSLITLLLRLRKERGVYDVVAVGDWRSRWMHRAIEVSRPKECVLLDDGIIVIHVLKQHLSNGLHNRLVARGNVIKRLANLIYWPLGSDGKQKYRFSLFTSFLPDGIHQGVSVKHNGYENLVSQTPRKMPYIGYFGTKYSETGYLSLDSEIEFLRVSFERLTRENPGKELLYFAHRGDGEAKLRLIKEMCVTVCEPDRPVEIYFLNHNPPDVIAGAFSTAVVNLAKLYSISNVTLMQLPLDKLDRSKLDHVRQIYDFYIEEGFRVVNPYLSTDEG